MDALTRELIITEVGGVRVGFVAYEVPDNAPDDVREGLVCRKLTLTSGVCPSCGETFTLPSRQQRRAAERHGEPPPIKVYHSAACPAGDQMLTAAIDRWHADGQ